VDFWERRVRNVADQAQFQNTGIVFPVAFDHGRLHGWNVRLDLAPLGGLTGYASVGHVRAVYNPPLAGGLFLDTGALDAITGGPFVIDHDQNLQIQGGLNYAFGKSGLWVAGSGRYDSGPVMGADENRAGSRTTLRATLYPIHSGGGLDPTVSRPDCLELPWEQIWPVWDTGRSSVDMLNAFDKKGVYNVLSTFGGTHVIPPRTFAGRMRVSF
jgi:hypothetical protein